MLQKLTFLIYFLISIDLHAQVIKTRNLPLINVSQLNSNSFESGKISVKFYRFQYLKIEQKINEFGFLEFNYLDLKKISTQFKFKKITSLFKNVLKNTEFQNTHKNWDLDLWYTIEFDAELNVQILYQELLKTNFFEIVEPVYKKHLLDEGVLNLNYLPNDARLNEQWSYNNTGQGGGIIGKDIRLLNAWDIEKGNPNVLVAVHDMGIQLDHPDLIQNIAVGKSFNFIDNNDTIVMGYHGTHVAGTIAAVNNNSIGVSGIAGGDGNINSGIRLMSMQIFKGNQSAGLAESFIYAADNGAAISNNSWAYDIENIYELSVMDAIDYFIENGGGNAIQGGLVIFASGNVSRQLSYFPSAYDRVICVSATNNKDRKANYATYGPWVDISAPGGDFNTGSSSQILSTTWYSGYSSDHGTSMSCPHVSGVAALIASKLLGKASASDVRDILLSTTDFIDTLNPNYKGLLGSGRLNAFKALQKTQAIFNSLNVLPVDSFSIINSCNEIKLNWKKNNLNQNVIIAVSNKNGISSLTNSQVYNVNDALAGEGKIIYKGSSNNFIIPKNFEQFYYFKIWSVDVNNNYSFGKTAEVVVNPTINSSGAISQNFDFPPYFPTQEWRTINLDNDLSWTHTAADTSNTGVADLYSMCMYNYNYNNLLGAEDVLTSPLINIKNTDSISLSFWHAYKFRNTGFTLSDSLEVLVSTDCGINYTSLWKKGGTNLATIINTSDTPFYPFLFNSWSQTKIDLTKFKLNDKLMIAFRSVNGKGNNLFIDNITVHVKYKRDIEMVKIISPVNSSCNQQIKPQIIIANKGAQTINNLIINYKVDNGNSIITNWNGILKTNDSIAIILTESIAVTGNHQLKIYTSFPNNLNDEFNLNDTLVSNFFITPAYNLPLLEGFEGNVFPINWLVSQKLRDAITWVKTDLIGKGSSSSIMLQNFMYDNRGRIDDLVTPYFYMDRNMDSTFLLFDYAHATKFSPTSLNEKFDSLEIAITTNCGETWNTIWNKSGNSLQTINQTQSYLTEFFPLSNQWKSDSVYISTNLLKADRVQIRFRNITNFGNNIYLDNIKFYTKYLAPNTKQNGYSIYPNPVLNKLTIQHLNKPLLLKTIKIINSIGKTINVKNYSGNASEEINLNLSHLATGVYIVQLIYTDKTISEKVLKYP